MQARRWQEIDRLFDAVLDREPAERASFLAEACAGDDELRREVEALLAAHVRADKFIEAPAMEMAVKAAASGYAFSVLGREIGPYRVLSPLGFGGMGEVYLAEDERLGRRVALKLLPPEFTHKAERIRRFEHEARAASALNHPNIVTIYEVGQSDGTYFIATELVEGQTLRDLMSPARTEMKVKLNVIAQVADALSAAHAAGIIHRDVKPENIMLRPDGYVKVLDFGLAKLSQPDLVHDPADKTTEILHTETGAVMGTAAYMSPEQALGQEVDHRTDIFSLGVVLYEMTSGKHPFRGPTAAATFDALLNREPPAPIDSNPDISPELERIIIRALEKDRELRYQTASDLRAELKRWQRTLDSSPTASTLAHLRTGRGSHPTRRAFVLRAGLALAALLFVAALIFVALRRSPPQKITTPPLKNLSFAQLTDQPGAELFPSLSPDGKSVVYASKATGNWDLYVQRVGGKNPRNLTADSTADDTQPAFSPDGERIAFRSERERGGLFVMGATGESVKRLTDFGYHPAWSPDGRDVAYCTHNIEDPNDRSLERSDIWIVNAATGEKRQLTGESVGDAAQPQWSPMGARIAYWSKRKGGQRDLWTIPAAGGTPIAVTDDAAFDWNPVWSPDGKYLYFASDRGGQMNLWRVAIEEKTGIVTGPPESLTTPSPYAEHLSFSRDGRRAVYVSQVSSKNILKAVFNPDQAVIGEPVAITQGFKHTAQPNLSPDGEWFVYSTQGEQQEDLFIIDKDGAGPPRQLTDDHFKDRHPRWSPDGKRIIFYSDRSGRYEAWTINRDGSGLKQMTFTTGLTVIYSFWSPDGARLIYNLQEGSCWIIEDAKPWGEQTPQRLPDPPDHSDAFRAFSWSPDGRKLGGWINSPIEHAGIMTYTFETNSFERITDFGSRPIWLHDSRRLLFRDGGKLFLVNSETKKIQEIPVHSPNPIIEYGLTGDSRTLYYTLLSTEADIWMINLE